jgi:octaprenyl-diphosphate synthase
MNETLREIYRPVAAPLERVRADVRDLWGDALRLAPTNREEVLPETGGKLLRPALCLLSAGAAGADDLDRFVRLAAAFEALHIASLTHDDVIDRSLLRRGQTSLNAMWDNHAAILGGDYLVARAVELLGGYGSCAVITAAISTVRRMAEGELLFYGRDNRHFTAEESLHLAERKTATLFAEACGAPASIMAPDHAETLRGFGLALGTAFQVVDDVLDVTRPAETLGKPACGDVVEGKLTLPIRYLRDGLDEAGNDRLDAMRGRELTDADRAWLQECVSATNAAIRAMAVAERYMAKARTCLEILPESGCRCAMEQLTSFILNRDS